MNFYFEGMDESTINDGIKEHEYYWNTYIYLITLEE